MPTTLPLDFFFQKPGIMLDVRSPSEFQQGHIPTSYSLPLFSDDERALIGTTYKQKSQEAAIHLGLQIVGPKLLNLTQQAQAYLQGKEGKILCWRGGMRSGFVARLFESIGLHTFTLQGGYQSFRRWVIKSLNQLAEHSPTFYILGGLTGSGKTQLLQCLRQSGKQILDLEALANHRGSAFGKIGLSQQPSQEQFENEIAHQLKQLDFNYPIWIEDEGRLIGSCHLPSPLYELMQQAPLYYIDIPKEQRLLNLLAIYGQASTEELIQATSRITKRLGGERTKAVLHFFHQNQKLDAFDLLLSYYDKAYRHHLSQRGCTQQIQNPLHLFQL